MKNKKAKNSKKKKLKIKELEKKIAPSFSAGKKAPVPPPYAPGTLYGLVRRDNIK